MKTVKILLSVMIAMSAVISCASAFASEKVTVAVLPFENAGVFERFDYLGTLLPLFLTSALVDIPEVSLVKRTDIQALLAEKKLGVDGLTAGEVKRVLGADILIKGTFEEKPVHGEDVSKSRLIIIFFIEETASGKTIATQEIKGSVDHLEETIKETVAKIVASLAYKKSIRVEKTPELTRLEAVKYFQQGKEIIKDIQKADYTEKDDKKALELFQRAAYLLPEWDKAWYEVGRRLCEIRFQGFQDEVNLDEAYQAFERVLKLTSDPDLAGNAMLCQGSIWSERNRHYLYGSEASRSTKKANKAVIKAQQVYIKMAKAYPHHSREGNALVNAMNMSSNQLAIEACNILIDHYGDSPIKEIGYAGLETVAEFARRRIGVYLLALKGHEEALHYLIPLLQSTDNPPALFKLNYLIGKIYDKNLDNIAAAIPYYQRAVDIDFDAEDVKFRRKHFDSAKRDIVCWGKWRIVKRLGPHFESKGNWRKAANLYQNLIKNYLKYSPDDSNGLARLYRKLGYCYEHLGEWQKALDAYQEADPHWKEVEEGIKRCLTHSAMKKKQNIPIIFWMEDEKILKTIGHFPKPPAPSGFGLGISRNMMVFAHGKLWLGFGPIFNCAPFVRSMKEYGAPWELSVIKYNHCEGKVEKVFSKEQGLPSFGITCMAASPNYIWAGTIGGGLLRFSPESENWKVYTTKEGLGNNHIFTLLVDGDYLWVGGGTDQVGILSRFSLKNGRWSNYAVPKILDCPITSLINQGDNLLVGTAEKGFFEFKKESGTFRGLYRLIFKNSGESPKYITRDIAVRKDIIWWKAYAVSTISPELYCFNLKTLGLSSWQNPPVIDKRSWASIITLTRVDSLLLASFARGDIGIFDTDKREWTGVIASRNDKAIGIGHHDGYIYVATQNGKLKRLSEVSLRKYLGR